jgi:hypothetical protein
VTSLKNRIHDAFHTIQAEESLKQDTLASLYKKMNQKQKRPVKKLAVSFAAFFLILFTGMLSYNFYFTESAYIDIDVNPSMELTLNRFNRVIDTRAYNDEANELLLAVDLKHKTYEEAVQLLIDKMIESGYLADDGLFTATLLAARNEDELLLSLQQVVDTSFTSHHVTLEKDVFAVDQATKTCSHEENLSPAKYLAILELKEVDPSATIENCKGHTISEIRQQTHAHTSSDESEAEHESSEDSTGLSDEAHDSTDEHDSSENDTHGNDH